MELSNYIKNLEPSETIILIISSCLISSILYHQFKANSILSITFGILGGYSIIELRKSKKMVPSQIINSQVSDLEDLLRKNHIVEDLSFLKLFPEILESLHLVLEIGKNNIKVYTETILFTNTFCNKLDNVMKNYKKDKIKSKQNYNDAKLLSLEILNSLHSLVYNISENEENSFTERLYIFRNNIKKILKKIKKQIKIKENSPIGSYNFKTSNYYFF